LYQFNNTRIDQCCIILITQENNTDLSWFDILLTDQLQASYPNCGSRNKCFKLDLMLC